MGEDAPRALYLALMLMLVASSLFAMRLPLGKALKMVLAWVAIFGGAFVLFAFRDDFSSLGQRLRAEATGAPIEAGEEVRIPIAEDGHFWVEARINGHQARFLIDSGASFTTLSRDAADAAGVQVGGRVAQVQTANGTVTMARGTAARFAVAGIDRADFPVHVNNRDTANVIGMNFLRTLRSWRVEGNYLVLQS